jgi:hypothetical protein
LLAGFLLSEPEMTTNRINPIIRFVVIYAIPFSVFIWGWWGCCESALINVFAEPVTARVTAFETTMILGKAGTGHRFTVVKYRFDVNGITHAGENVTCCDGLLKRSGVDSVISEKVDELRRQGAKQATVWVNPSYPQHAVLLRDVPNDAIGLFIFTLLLSYALSRIVIFRLVTGRWPRKFEKI